MKIGKEHKDLIMPASLPGPHEMNLNPVTLKFQDWIEKDFLKDYCKNSLGLVRISLLAGIILYSLFGFLDVRLVPEKKTVLWFIRFAVVLPCLTAVILLTYWSKFQSIFQISVAAAMAIAGVAINIMIALISPPVSFTYYVGLILVFIWGYSFTRVRFIWATAAGWLIVISYEIIAVYVKQTPQDILLTNNFFFISANVIGMCVCYSIEYYARANFYINYLLEKEREKISQANRRLEEIVKNRTIELTDTNKNLRQEIDERHRLEKKRTELETQLQRAQKLEAIGTLAGGVAHDFNNLLMGIQGNTSVVLSRLDPDDPNYQKLVTAQSYVKKSSELANQLLGFARGGAYELKATDLNQLIEKVSKMFGRTKKEIVIFTHFKEGLLSVNVDRRQIEQVLLNLFINAAQAMPKGGRLYVQTDNVQLDKKFLEAHHLEPGMYVKVSVADTGIGIDPENIERVFDPFYTTKERGRGTGLGLASAYGIVKSHGGFIDVQSEVNKGSTFSFYIPPHEGREKKTENKKENVINGSGKILLIDDEDMILEEVGEMLATLGYEVVPAKGGSEAIKLFTKAKNEFDLVILDMIMPEINGSKTFERLRSINPQARILLSSGYSMNAVIQNLVDQGANGFIQKPFDRVILSHKIEKIINGDTAIHTTS